MTQTLTDFAMDLDRHLFRKGIQIAQKHLKRRSTLIVIREMEIKTTMTYDFMPIRIAILNKTNKNC